MKLNSSCFCSNIRDESWYPICIKLVTNSGHIFYLRCKESDLPITFFDEEDSKILGKLDLSSESAEAEDTTDDSEDSELDEGSSESAPDSDLGK